MCDACPRVCSSSMQLVLIGAPKSSSWPSIRQLLEAAVRHTVQGLLSVRSTPETAFMVARKLAAATAWIWALMYML